MSQATTDLKLDLQKGLDHVRALRDEVRVKIHLAGMDARDEWHKLEPHLLEVERSAEHRTESARTAVQAAAARLAALLRSLK